jgi:hypothetical protein
MADEHMVGAEDDDVQFMRTVMICSISIRN